MEIKQIYELTNDAVKQAIGESVVLQEDLGNLVDVGDAILNANSLDKYVDALVDKVGKMVFVTRKYQGVYAKLQMDGWEFGAILQKVSMQLPNAEENESWELTDGAVYEENQFYKPIVSVKFFNKKTTFEIPMSITDIQVKSAFNSSTQLNSFISMIFNSIENAMTLRLEEMSRRAVNNMIGEVVYDGYGSGSQTASSKVRAVNLLYLYNQAYPNDTIATLSEGLQTPEFLRFAFYTMSLYKDRLGTMSTLFNLGAKERFTPSDRLHFILLSNFDKASQVYLQSDTYHDNLVKLDGYETIPYFQGTGTSYALSDVSKIKIKTASGNTIEINGVIGAMFDHDAIAINNDNRRTTSKWNAKAEFTNYWFKADASYINDGNENCVVFFGA